MNTAISGSQSAAPTFRLVYRATGWWLLPALCFLPMLGGLPLVLGGDGVLRFSNAAAPLVLLFVTGFAAIVTVRRYPLAIWTPYVAFLAQSALFFGFGPLVYVFGNPLTIAELSATRLAISDLELARTNLLVEVGIASTMWGLWLYSILGGRRAFRSKASTALRKFTLPRVAILFLVVGGILRYGLLLPNQFGVTNFVIPGFITSSSNLFALGLAVTGYLAVQRKGLWRAAFWALLLPNLAVAVLQFSKTAAMISLLVPALGCYLAHRRLSRLAVWVIVAAILFATMQPLVAYGRNQIASQTGEIGRATLAERFSIARAFAAGQHTTDSPEKSQPAWTRLAYAGPQAYAMNLYDSGITGTSLRNAWLLFIPRVIWPGKPIVLGPGAEFYAYVTGREGTFLGLSVYGDSYWQGGWLGVLGFSFFMGIVFGWLSRNSLQWMSAGSLVYLPLVLLALETGMLGPTKYIVNGIIGPLPIYVGYLLLLNLGLRVRIRDYSGVARQ